MCIRDSFSRPDISLAVNHLSVHQGFVTRKMMAYINRIIRYTYLTKSLHLSYSSSNQSAILSAFVDATHASETDSKSISGILVFHCNNLFDWKTKKQTAVSHSSTAAEISAVSDSLDHFLIPREILVKIFATRTPIHIYKDNSSAAYVMEDGQNENLRWVLIKARAILDEVKAGNIMIHQVPAIPGKQQLADGMTKLL